MTERVAEMRELREQGWSLVRVGRHFGVSERSIRRALCSPHIYVIDPPNGPTSMGVCKRCRARKEHLNTIPRDVWLSNYSRPHKGAAAAKAAAETRRAVAAAETRRYVERAGGGD